MKRYHIEFGKHRTTVSVDPYLADMLSIFLDREPGSPQATRAVRDWLQARLPHRVGEGRGFGKRASLYARRLMVEAIADKEISDRYDDWVIANSDRG